MLNTQPLNAAKNTGTVSILLTEVEKLIVLSRSEIVRMAQSIPSLHIWMLVAKSSRSDIDVSGTSNTTTSDTSQDTEI